MGTINIDIKQHIQEFQIGTKKFGLELKDEKLSNYLVEIANIDKTVETLEADMDKDPKAAFAKVESHNRAFIEICFGGDAYDQIFKEVGESSYVMSQVCENIATEVKRIVTDMNEAKKTAKKSAYYNSKKQSN